MRILVTGVYGFIGSYFTKWLLSYDPDVQIVGFGRSSDQRNAQRVPRHPRLQLIHGDLRGVSGICEHIDVVVNFAAMTFVDHSLKDRRPFRDSNLVGADSLMDDADRYDVKRFVQVSTDEVYGQILVGSYKEDALLNPRNPYSLYKAAADLSAIQRHRTDGFPVIITRTENNFGPWQHRQKALPTFVREALAGRPIPVYGDGLHVRCWLHVEEHCKAIWHLVLTSFETDILGEVFHVAGEQELANIDLAHIVLRTLDKPRDQIVYIADHNIRPGHDRRYALNCDKLKSTGFTIRQDLEAKLKETIEWYQEHPEWIR